MFTTEFRSQVTINMCATFARQNLTHKSLLLKNFVTQYTKFNVNNNECKTDSNMPIDKYLYIN